MLITDWYLVTLLLQKGRYQLSLVVFFFNISILSVARYSFLQKDNISLNDDSKAEGRKVLRTDLEFL